MTWASLWVFALTASSPRAPVEFDLEQRAASLQVVLKNLSERSGVPMKAAPAIANEIVLIAAKNTTVEELKSQLAKTLDATWTKASDAEYLIRTPAQTKAIYDRHLAYRRELVDEAMAELKKPLEKVFDGGSLAAGLLALKSRYSSQNDPVANRQTYDEERRLFGNGPAARLVRRLLLACRPVDLASIGPYSRAVFKANPTTRQYGFVQDQLQTAIETYAVEQSAWVKAASSVSFTDRDPSRLVSDPRGQLAYPTQVPSDFKLVVLRGDMANLFMVNLVWPGNEGRSQVVAQLSVEDPMRKFLDSTIFPKATDGQDPLVPLSSQTILFNKRTAGLNQGLVIAPLDAESLELILNPERHDPNSFGVSDGLLAAAQHLNKNVVAALPDMAASLAWFVTRENPQRVGAFLRDLIASGTINSEDDGGWLRMRPTDEFEAMLHFTQRDAMAFLTQSVHRNGRLDVRDYATYAYRSKRVTRVGLGEVYLMLLDPSVSSGLDRTDWSALQLYGSFDRINRARLEQGARFLYTGLSSEQKKIVERMTFAGEIQNEERIDADSVRLKGPSIEPTEAFANGVPPEAVVYAKANSIPVILAYGKDSKGKVTPLRTVNESTVAVLETEAKGNEEKMRQFGVSGLAGYAMGQQRMISLRIELAPNLWRESTISVLEPNEDAQPGPWEGLPENLVESIRQSIDRKNQPPVSPPIRPPLQ